MNKNKIFYIYFISGLFFGLLSIIMIFIGWINILQYREFFNYATYTILIVFGFLFFVVYILFMVFLKKNDTIETECDKMVRINGEYINKYNDSINKSYKLMEKPMKNKIDVKKIIKLNKKNIQYMKKIDKTSDDIEKYCKFDV